MGYLDLTAFSIISATLTGLKMVYVHCLLNLTAVRARMMSSRVDGEMKDLPFLFGVL